MNNISKIMVNIDNMSRFLIIINAVFKIIIIELSENKNK